VSTAAQAGQSWEDPFTGSRACFEDLIGWLEGTEAATLTHGQLEEQLDLRGRELLRRMFQGQLDLRAMREHRTEVTDAEGIRHGAVETGHVRALTSLFGSVQVTRLAYRHRGHVNLYAADGLLNLPAERHSHGIRRLAAVEASRGSFEEAAVAIGGRTGASIGKRQVESLTARAAADVGDFYATRRPPPSAENELLVISADGKGIVMRPDSLRPATAAKAAAASAKLKTRLSKGEKRNRKRLAEVGAVYDLTPTPRTAAEVMDPHHDSEDHEDQQPTAPNGPRAKNKWVTASHLMDRDHVRRS
jgi:hypothetical protein